VNQNFASYDLLGVRVNTLTIAGLHAVLERTITTNCCSIIANHNLHSLYLYHKDPIMRAFYERADYIHIDGMPLVFLGRLTGLPFRREHRVTYVDWVWSLMAKAVESNWRIFYLGSKPGIAESGEKILRERFANLHLMTTHGYFDVQKGSEENSFILKKINEYRPHVLMVGMGMPRQEHWIIHNLDEIKANAILTAGACMDYVAGVVPTPPRWAGKIGAEWLFRLAVEPRRLWHRYLVEPWFLLRVGFAEYLKRVRSF
jgi:N-acetylglucosaminyldiphosphoundecaprenol N-acetyl-beta-D-mannosaminyltransferase